MYKSELTPPAGGAEGIEYLSGHRCRSQARKKEEGWVLGQLPITHKNWKTAKRSIKEPRTRTVSDKPTRQRQRKMIFGTWNVKTLLKPGRVQELIDQIDKTQLNIVALQEIRWSGSGTLKKGEYTIYYNGPENRTGQAGTGFLIKKNIQSHLIGFTPINERITKLRIKGKFNNITLINVYAPTNEMEDEIKEEFYEKLQSVVEQIPKSDTLLLLGDLNAQIGKEKIHREITGVHSLHELTNQNGELLCGFAAINDLVVMSTHFCHKPIHKGTWISPDRKTVTQIDHVLVSRSKMDLVEDVRSLRGPNVDSDHYLLKVILNLKLPRMFAKIRRTQVTNWNRMELKDPEKRKKYRLLLAELLRERQIPEDVHENWTELKEKIQTAARNTIGSEGKRLRNDWWDIECQTAIQKKNEARMKLLQLRTRSCYENYQEKRKIANRICQRKKKVWINAKVKEIEENFKRNESRKFFTGINGLQYKSRNYGMCKDKKGNMLTQELQIMNRWKEYFEEVFNPPDLVANESDAGFPDINEEQEDLMEPTFNEICYIINNLKSNKAAGSDNISAELIKYGGRTIKKEIHKLITSIWQTQKLPEQWTEGIIFPLHKKGDRFDCGNHRPITLLNVVYKIFAIVLNTRLSNILERKLHDCQTGFRKNRSTIDNIFLMRQVLEKSLEYDIELHNMFIDYSQAFDSVLRHTIMECLTIYGVPAKLRNLIGLTLTNTKARVRINNQLSEEFQIKFGVRQGDPLSATLFLMVMDRILSQLDIKGDISTRLKQCVAYADDVLLISRTKKALEQFFRELKDKSLEFGLKVNVHKTKYMRSGLKQQQPKGLKIDNVLYEEVGAYKYLGAILNQHNNIEEEIKARIAAGNRAYFANLQLFKSKLLSKKAKLRLYQVVIRPIVTYAAETWTLRSNDKQRLSVFERRILRKIFGPIKTPSGDWRIRSNMELDELIEHKNIINYIKGQRLSWLGHVHRMESDRSVKKIYSWVPLKSRRKGRPKTRWKDDVVEDITRMKIRNWMPKLQNRKEWKAIIEQAKTFKTML